MTNNLYDIAVEKLGGDAFKGTNVVDVGCMRFAVSKALRDLGAKVTGIDICEREAPPEGIAFVHADFLDWEPTEIVDVLYLSNSSQFMPTEKVFEKIKSVNPRSIVVRTMYAYPEPNWDASELLKMYFTVPEDWTAFFEKLGYETKLARKYEHDSQDFKHRDRKFRFVDYIGTKVKR